MIYDFNRLPDPITETLQSIVVAAQSGDIDEMLPVLEENELKPMVADTHVDDPSPSGRRIRPTARATMFSQPC